MKASLLLLALVATVFLAQSSQTSLQSKLEPVDTYISGLQLTSLAISADSNSNAILQFTSGGGVSLLVALLAETGSLVISNQRITLYEAKESGEIIIQAQKVATGDVKFFGDLYVQTTPQWKQIIHENFWNQATGWTLNEVTTCGGIHMLGGYGVLSSGKLNKTFIGLPEHKKLRVVATFHFIDAWTGEAAYLIANSGRNRADEYVWIDTYDSTDAEKDINICGSSYGEGKFTSSIDVSFPHTDDTLKLSFGSTVDQDPLAESWGISSLYIYII